MLERFEKRILGGEQRDFLYQVPRLPDVSVERDAVQVVSELSIH